MILMDCLNFCKFTFCLINVSIYHIRLLEPKVEGHCALPFFPYYTRKVDSTFPIIPILIL